MMMYKTQQGFCPSKKLTIGVDFDGTLFKWTTYPDIGEPVPLALETIKELQAAGHEIVIWTCRHDGGLEMAKEKLKKHDIEIGWYNYLPDQEHLSAKLDVDFLIDDKTVGCPLIYEFGQRKPYVDWEKIRELIAPIRRLTLEDIEDYEIDVMASNGYDYSEGGICKAWDKAGNELTADELDWLNEVGSPDAIQEIVMEHAREKAIDAAENMMDAARDAEMGL